MHPGLAFQLLACTCFFLRQPEGCSHNKHPLSWCWLCPRGLLWALHHPCVSVPLTVSQPKMSWERQHLTYWLLGWWENLQSPSVPRRMKAKGSTGPLTPTLMGLSCTLTMTMKRMKMRTAVETVSLFSQEVGREEGGGQKQRRFIKNGSLTKKQTSDVLFPLIFLSQIRTVYIPRCSFWWKAFPKEDSMRGGQWGVDTHIRICPKSQSFLRMEAVLRMIKVSP